MTDEERALRRKLAGLGTSHTRTMLALEFGGYAPTTMQKYRAKLAVVKQKQAELGIRLNEVQARSAPPDAVRFPVLFVGNGNAQEFVAFWELLYSGYDEDFYAANIGETLTPERIAAWFEWKNGTPLSSNKMKTILRYSLPEEQVAPNADEDMIAKYLNRPGGAIWRIFFLHLQHPTRFPIYDQHVHRAMAFMQASDSLEIPLHNPTKVRTYLGTYLPFFKSFATIQHRRVDRALWAFGKFLSTGYGEALFKKG